MLLFAPPGSNRILRKIYGREVHPLRMGSFDSFREDLLSAIEKDGDDDYIWIAVAEDSTLYLYQLMEAEPHQPVRYLLPDRPTFELARNKAKFQAFCEANGLPVPTSFSADELTELKRDFRPLIAKKRIGAGAVGIVYVEEPYQLALLDNIDKDDFIVQEKITSTKKIHGFFCVAREGEVISWHGHERLRTFPEKDGVTVFSRSQYDPKCKEIASQLIKKMNWSGFAMVEFLQDSRSGEWKIIELNPRLWGSVMLSEFCGSRILSNYVKVLTGEEPDSGDELPDRYIRWVVPFELINLLKGSITPGDLLNRRGLDICYVNITYSNFLRALLFQTYSNFRRRSISRFFKKLLS
jgi:predicted ATP-grasp superfamily ATP-dependent carboligase